MSPEMEKALNEQINEEMYSSYLYLSMATYMHDKNLDGLANWMRIQSQEEQLHSNKIFDFIIERGGRVILEEIHKPQSEWETPVSAFEDTLAHEKHITGKINDLVNLALKEGDHAVNSFLQWFVDEQVEEEATAETILQQMKMVGDHPMGLFMLDKDLGQRVFTPPPAQ